jgi:multimeric flavodoxin WrbA
MKVIAINGSPRPDGNTSMLIQRVFAPLQAAGIETETYQLGGKLLHGCIACYACMKTQDGHCAIKGDAINECIEKMVAADGIILGSPTYFADVTTEMKAMIDRAGLVCRASGNLLRRKVGAAVVAVRRAGSIRAFDTMNHFLHINQMIVPGSSYWNLAVGRDKGEVENDEEGMRTMQVLGENMAWLLEKTAGA